ncbi:uncharacterized protein LOC114578710 [Dendrobium catenatum]|uniref:uncharacterized protein LOC114578710 n=1 Tax=Dendrobium catenatum TaxID=906689 RepID=UPI00109F56A9|nr:uncharacterized protein LOC114578710 [Dendrobium catenatum]
MVEFMSTHDLHDLGFSGPTFTWSNNKSGSSKIWVRLDRVLMNSEGLRRAPLANVRHLVRISSDHCPLLVTLESASRSKGSKWLRFEDIWMTYPATWKLVWKNWNKLDYGQPDAILNRKCSRTLRALYHWSRNRLKELGELKSSLEARIETLQIAEGSLDGLTTEQDAELRRLAGELITTLPRLTTWWRQCAKTKWIEEGDANSHFFHTNASARRRGNTIKELSDSNGERILEPQLIHDEFWNFFSLKWRDRQVRLEDWPVFNDEDRVPAHFQTMLDAEVTDLEIQQAVFSLGNNRSPGTDGINASFLKFYWKSLREMSLRPSPISFVLILCVRTGRKQ